MKDVALLLYAAFMGLLGLAGLWISLTTPHDLYQWTHRSAEMTPLEWLSVVSLVFGAGFAIYLVRGGMK
jgi:hypothetical protein